MQSLRLLSLAVHRGAEIAEWAVEDKVGSRVLREICKAEMGGRLGSQLEVRQPELVFLRLEPRALHTACLCFTTELCQLSPQTSPQGLNREKYWRRQIPETSQKETEEASASAVGVEPPLATHEGFWSQDFQGKQSLIS